MPFFRATFKVKDGDHNFYASEIFAQQDLSSAVAEAILRTKREDRKGWQVLSVEELSAE